MLVPSFSLFICFRKFSSVREGAAQLHDHARGAGRGARSARRSSSGARPARSLRRRRLVQRPAHSGASQRGGGAGLVAANGCPRPTRGQARTSRPDRSSQPSQHKARGPGAAGRVVQAALVAGRLPEPALGQVRSSMLPSGGAAQASRQPRACHVRGSSQQTGGVSKQAFAAH